MTFFRHLWQRVQRRKHVDIEDTNTNLKRCLTLKRLIFIGVGKTVGVGIYVLIGVATQQAGPGVIFSFLIGFLVTLLNALCFAEYASKSPKAGAQYTYMYETIGEGVAFIVGWTNCVGSIAALSLATRGWSGYLDSFFNHRIENFTESHIAHWTQGPPMPEYPDLPAIGMVLFIMVIVSLGVNCASIINTVLATVSVSILMFIVVFGLFYANFDNWFKNGVGFFPNGLQGVLKAAASCFYAYQGFDILGYSTEETVNPKKDIPRSIVSVLLIVTGIYLSVAVTFTLMTPMSEISTKSPFPNAFAYHSVTWAKYLVAVGPVLALSNLCMLELFGIQRLIYSMSSDGLLFSVLSVVNQHTNVPIGPVFMCGPIVIILVLTIDLSNLIGFMIIFIFIQYSLFSAYLIILRYDGRNNEDKLKGNDSEVIHVQCNDRHNDETTHDAMDCDEFEIEDVDHAPEEDTKDLIFREPETGSERNNVFRLSERSSSTHTSCGSCGCFSTLSTRISVTQLVVLIYCLTFFLTLHLIYGLSDIVINVGILTLLGGPLLFATFLIWCKEQKGDRNGFLVPLMPFLPVTCLFFNLIMLLSVIDKGSALAAAVMTLMGAVIYLAMAVIDYMKNGWKLEATSSESAELLAETEDETTTSTV